MFRLRWWDGFGLLIIWLLAEGATGAMFGEFGYFTSGSHSLSSALLGLLCIVPLAILYRFVILFQQFDELQDKLARRGELEEKRDFRGGLNEAEEAELDSLCSWWRSKALEAHNIAS